MGKKLFSLCMALALCLGLLPVTALAAGEDVPNDLYVGTTNIGTTSYNDNAAYWTSADGGTTWTSQLNKPEGDSYIYYNGQGTLKLHNVTIRGTFNESNPSGAGIYALCRTNQSVSLTIQLTGNNTITGDYGIYVEAQQGDTLGANASLIITGDGSLTVTGTSSYGLYVKSGTGNASLTIEDASVDAKFTSSSAYVSYAGVCVGSSDSATAPALSLAVNGGSLTANGRENSVGIQFDVASSQANNATTSLTVDNNAIVKAINGIGVSRVHQPIPSGIGIVFDDKEGTVYGDVTLDESLTINQGETLTVPSGSSLNCNGNLTNSGTIIVENGGTVSGILNDGTTLTTPSISQQPQSTTVTEGEDATFTVEASAGSETLTYQWQQSTDNGSSWTNIESGTSASYTINSTNTSMNDYQYRCVVTGSGGVSVISQTATLTVQAKPASVPVTGVKLNTETLELFTGNTATLTATVLPDDATNKNVTWQSDNANVATVQNGTVNAVGAGEATITVTTQDGGKTDTCTVTVEEPYTPPPYIPPTKTPSEQAIDKIEDAKEGSTVKITLRTGQTKLDKEVFEELAGRDVTLEISLPGGVTWTVNGEDIPKTADLTDLDMGVSLNTSTIPVDLINAITGEIGTVQLTLKHDGPFGFTMTLTAPVGKENKGLWANLYHYDEDAGEMVYQTAAQVDEDGNAALPFDHASQYAIVLDSKSHDLPFTDLAADAWYTDAVAYVYRHDIMEGMSATTFQPNGTLTRAMAVQIFYNLEGQPDISGENLGYLYEDVDAQAWYGDAVYWARITGVATGYGDGTFQPGDSITRQEFAQMLYNYAKYKGYDLTAEGDLSQFSDSGSVADWAEAAMSWANGNKLINGHDDGTIDAAGTATREQAASILMRFDQNLVEK